MDKIRARLDITAINPILVDAGRCDLCGGCVGICPPDVLVMSENRLEVREGCIKCGLCIPACPVEALSWNEGVVHVSGNGNGKLHGK